MIDLYTVSQRLKLHEGLRLQPYRCSRGKLTIGVGRNLDDNPFTVEEEKIVGDWRHGITKEVAMYLLRNDIKTTYRNLKKYIPCFSELDEERKYALIDMAFNLGIVGLLKFQKMLAHIACGNYEQAADECLNSRYAKITGRRAERIAEVIRSGVFRL